MEDTNTEFISVIAGGIVTLIISIAKRWIVFDKTVTGLLVLLVSFFVSSAITLFSKGFSWKNYIENIVLVYGASQAAYWTIMQSMGLGDKIEGK